MTSVELDEKLVQEALELSGKSSLEEVVGILLEDYVRRRKQQKILELFGTIEYEPDWDYKAQRQIP